MTPRPASPVAVYVPPVYIIAAISCFLPGRTASAVRQAVNVRLKEMRVDELQCRCAA